MDIISKCEEDYVPLFCDFSGISFIVSLHCLHTIIRNYRVAQLLRCTGQNDVKGTDVSF